jgi:hypothetical protein
MSKLEEIEATLNVLSTHDLLRLETAIRQLYRERKVPLIYDDSYGAWSEEDQLSAAAQTLVLMDQPPNEPPAR